MTSARPLLFVLLAAIGLTLIFWLPLWTGGGFVGGDVYTYGLPLKQYLADQLHQGEFPLWNNRVGHGFPLIAESQTAAYYLPNLLLYGLLPLHTAFVASFLIHYVLAFVFTAMYARWMGLSLCGALLAALVYTYGWFPPRASLEWAIIGGTYLPLALWCVETCLQTASLRQLVLLAVVLAMQMLAGHFHLAFIIQLVLVAYVIGRLWWARENLAPRWLGERRRLLLLTCLAMAGGFALAAEQLFPTWQLRADSQRASTGETPEDQPFAGKRFNAAEGHIPPLYLSQVVLSWWYWYAPEIDTERAVRQLDWLAVDADTNMIEAHLYFGLIPLGLAVWFAWRSLRSPESVDRRFLLWAAGGLLAVIYATGWLLPVTRHLPGFGFFLGPGRYGIVTTLAVALLSAGGLDVLQQCIRRAPMQQTLRAIILLLTVADLWLVSRLVTNAYLVPQPPIAMLEQSDIRRILSQEVSPVRLWAPGPNVATLLGVSATPPYLGLGPRAYYDPRLTMPLLPETDDPQRRAEAIASQVTWLRKAGVTHILRMEPLDLSLWPVAVEWEGGDPFLNRVWGRGQDEPLYLYRLQGSRGRVAFEVEAAGTPATSSEMPQQSARISIYEADRVVIEASAETAGTLILTDLYSSGWDVTVDDKPATPVLSDGMYRGVELPPGRHKVVWSYRPLAVYWGGGASVLALLALIAAALWVARRNAIPGTTSDPSAPGSAGPKSSDT